MRYYEENVAEAIAPMDANVSQCVKLLFRKGEKAGEGKPAFTATARRSHSFFGMRALPDLPPDTDVVSDTLAAVTMITRSKPMVSTRIWRLRPLTCLPAS